MARSQPAPLPATLALNCLVFGDIESFFTVEIANTSRVSVLKKEIWKEKQPELNYAPADALKLWMVN